jgi:hypothetical protein
MMRISPLGIFGATHDLEHVAGWARQDAVVDTVKRGGDTDTDTNAAICGALLGAVWGRNVIPDQWSECLLNCRPAAGQPHVSTPAGSASGRWMLWCWLKG